MSTIRKAIERGELERVIRGWYVVPGADRDAVRAMRLGGRLGCISALRLHGAWVPPDTGAHVAMPSFASGRRLSARGLPANTTPHWHLKDDQTGSAFPVAPLELAVEDALTCQPPQFVIAAFDSLLHRGLLSQNRLEAIIARGPVRRRFLTQHLRPESEDGMESIARFLLETSGIRCDIQVIVRSSYRVDLLIDGWLVVELDGRATHAQADAFTRDRVRAANIVRDGKFVLQFAYATVLYDWPFVIETIRSVLAQHGRVR